MTPIRIVVATLVALSGAGHSMAPARTGAGPAFGTYLWDDAAGAYIPGGLDVLTIQNGRVAQIVAFLSADLTNYGLPASLPA